LSNQEGSSAIDSQVSSTAILKLFKLWRTLYENAEDGKT